MIAGFKQLNGEISGIKSDIADLKTDVAGLKTDVATLKTDVADLKTDVATLKADVTDLKDNQVKMQADISGLKEDVLRIEDTMHDKFGALFDARQAQLECNFRVENTLTRIENKLDKAELRSIGAFDLASRRLR